MDRPATRAPRHAERARSAPGQGGLPVGVAVGFGRLVGVAVGFGRLVGVAVGFGRLVGVEVGLMSLVAVGFAPAVAVAVGLLPAASVGFTPPLGVAVAFVPGVAFEPSDSPSSSSPEPPPANVPLRPELPPLPPFCPAASPLRTSPMIGLSSCTKSSTTGRDAPKPMLGTVTGATVIAATVTGAASAPPPATVATAPLTALLTARPAGAK